MRRLVFVVVLATALAGFAAPGTASPVDGRTETVAAVDGWSGPVLVDKLVALFEQMAASKANIDPVLDDLMASARKSKAEHRIDDKFFARYTRLLRVFKLMTLDDKEGILRPVAERECVAFVKDVEGVDAPDGCGIPALAKAITRELQSLKE